MPKQSKDATKTLSVRVSMMERLSWQSSADECGQTMAEWIRRQCNATLEGATIATMVADEICARWTGAGFGNPPPPMKGFIRESTGGRPAMRGGVSRENLENLRKQISKKRGQGSGAGGAGGEESAEGGGGQAASEGVEQRLEVARSLVEVDGKLPRGVPAHLKKDALRKGRGDAESGAVAGRGEPGEDLGVEGWGTTDTGGGRGGRGDHSAELREGAAGAGAPGTAAIRPDDDGARGADTRTYENTGSRVRAVPAHMKKKVAKKAKFCPHNFFWGACPRGCE